MHKDQNTDYYDNLIYLQVLYMSTSGKLASAFEIQTTKQIKYETFIFTRDLYVVMGCSSSVEWHHSVALFLEEQVIKKKVVVRTM